MRKRIWFSDYWQCQHILAIIGYSVVNGETWRWTDGGVSVLVIVVVVVVVVWGGKCTSICNCVVSLAFGCCGLLFFLLFRVIIRVLFSIKGVVVLPMKKWPFNKFNSIHLLPVKKRSYCKCNVELSWFISKAWKQMSWPNGVYAWWK